MVDNLDLIAIPANALYSVRSQTHRDVAWSLSQSSLHLPQFLMSGIIFREMKTAYEYLFHMSNRAASPSKSPSQSTLSRTRERLTEVANSSLAVPEYFVTPEEAGAFLRCSPITVKRLAREGRIPAHSITNGVRKRWRFLISELADRMQAKVSLETSSAPLTHGGSGK
jgi:Helix-turn-helix domain